MCCAPQATWKILDQVLLQNTSQKMFIGTDKISEIFNDLDLDGVVLVNFLTATVQHKFTLQQQQQH